MTTLLPAGKQRSQKYLVGDVLGNPGDSLEISLKGDRAGLWHDHATGEGGDIFDEWDRAFLTAIATKLYGARTQPSCQSTPWRTGDVIDRGDGETWTAVATTSKSVTIQRNRDGALATLGQLGEGRR